MTRLKLSNNVILILIILAASALRLYNLFEIPFTPDEFSALFRTHFNSFSELIDKGVKVDTLPPGVQVWLYFWTKLCGYSEWIVKLPFIICGILSVYLIYLIARTWYNETVALISASFLASIQYTVMYSQIARPYASGLFLSLLMVCFWTKIMLTPQKKFCLNSFLFILSAALCSYNHHFSLLFAVVVGVSGLFMINRQYLLKYMVSCVFVILLYVPNIGIFMQQLNMGGNEGWLGKIHNDFFINYLGYSFQFSAISYVLVILLILSGFLKIKKQDINYRHFILFSCWFFIPFLIGFIYSKCFNNVLQYSVLIFNFPFLFFVLFGHIKLQKAMINLLLVLAILSINIYSLTVVRKHYALFYNSPYINILTDHQKAVNSYTGIASIIDSGKKVSGFYIKKFKLDTNFIWYDSVFTEKNLIHFLKNQSQISDYLYFGCLTGNSSLIVTIIQDYYPTIEKQNNYAGGTTFVFSKEENNETNIIEYQDFEVSRKEFWSSSDSGKYVDSIWLSGKTSYLIDNKTKYSPAYSRSLKEIISNRNNFIDISVKACLFDKHNDAILVASIDSRGKNIYWGGTSFNKFIPDEETKEKWITMHHSVKLSDIDINYQDIKLKIYIWNIGQDNFLIDDFKIELRNGNPVIYGLTEKLQK